MSRALRGILTGGLLVGTLDALDAAIFFGIRSGTTLPRVFRGIAAGLLGAEARTGGLVPTIVGALLHYFIATCIVAVFYLVATRIRVLSERPFVFGPLYGLAAYAVMNYVVIPLAFGAANTPKSPVLANGLFIHMFGIGIPAALTARWILRPPSPGMRPA